MADVSRAGTPWDGSLVNSTEHEEPRYVIGSAAQTGRSSLHSGSMCTEGVKRGFSDVAVQVLGLTLLGFFYIISIHQAIAI